MTGLMQKDIFGNWVIVSEDGTELPRESEGALIAAENPEPLLQVEEASEDPPLIPQRREEDEQEEQEILEERGQMTMFDFAPKWKDIWRGMPEYEHDAISGKKVVILSIAEEQDGKKWAHASISRKNRLPDYNDLIEMKNIFIGPNRKAVQIFAPMSEHVDIHKFCLHLWACLDGDPLPDFTRGGKSI